MTCAGCIDCANENTALNNVAINSNGAAQVVKLHGCDIQTLTGGTGGGGGTLNARTTVVTQPLCFGGLVTGYQYKQIDPATGNITGTTLYLDTQYNSIANRPQGDPCHPNPDREFVNLCSTATGLLVGYVAVNKVNNIRTYYDTSLVPTGQTQPANTQLCGGTYYTRCVQSRTTTATRTAIPIGVNNGTVNNAWTTPTIQPTIGTQSNNAVAGKPSPWTPPEAGTVIATGSTGNNVSMEGTGSWGFNTVQADEFTSISVITAFGIPTTIPPGTNTYTANLGGSTITLVMENGNRNVNGIAMEPNRRYKFNFSTPLNNFRIGSFAGFGDQTLDDGILVWNEVQAETLGPQLTKVIHRDGLITYFDENDAPLATPPTNTVPCRQTTTTTSTTPVTRNIQTGQQFLNTANETWDVTTRPGDVQSVSVILARPTDNDSSIDITTSTGVITYNQPFFDQFNLQTLTLEWSVDGDSIDKEVITPLIIRAVAGGARALVNWTEHA